MKIIDYLQTSIFVSNINLLYKKHELIYLYTMFKAYKMNLL